MRKLFGFFLLAIPAFAIEYNVQDYGVTADRLDHTGAMLALLAKVNAAGGGRITFPPVPAGDWYQLGCILFPNDNAQPFPHQNPIIISGAGGWQSHPSGWPDYPAAGSLIKSTCTGQSAVFDTRGDGYLEIAGLSVVAAGPSDVPYFIHGTNTVLNVHDNAFAGRVVPHATPTQDAISLGDESTLISGAFDAPFQGYGTRIWHNHFLWMRRGIWCRAYCNAVVIDHNDWPYGGGRDATVGAIDLHGSGAGNSVGASGNVITNNIIEVTDGYSSYVYPIRITNGQNNYIAGNGCYDADPTVAGACVYFGLAGAGTGGNFAILNESGRAGKFLDYIDTGSTNIVLSQSPNGGLLIGGGGHEIGVDAAKGDATISTYVNGVRKWSWYAESVGNVMNLYDWTAGTFRARFFPDGTVSIPQLGGPGSCPVLADPNGKLVRGSC